MTKEPQKPTKSLIFLKASVIAFGIVFLVLFAALLILKAKKSDQKPVSNCEKLLQLEITGEVEKMEAQGNSLTILTKLNPKTRKQEIIKFDNNCVKIINRIELDVR